MARGGSSIWADQLGQLLGLDKESVKQQVLPFLDSFDDRAALLSHLEGLLGTGDAKANSFISSFVESRFPAPKLVAAPARPAELRPSTTGPLKLSKGKKSLSARAGIGKALPPRQIDDHDQRMEELSAEFGSMGTVYMKKRDEALDFFPAKGKGKGSGSKGASPAATPGTESQGMSRVATPDRQSLVLSLQQAAKNALNAQDAQVQAPQASQQPPGTASSPKPPKPKETHPPTAEMLAIDVVIAELTFEGASSSTAANKDNIRYKRCFCQDLVAKLAAEREDLVEQQRIQIEILREQKRLNKEKRKEEQAMFPQLGEATSSAAATKPTQTAVVGKHGGMARARTLAQDAQRTAKVLSLNMKTHKVTVPRKAKAKSKVADVGASGSAAPGAAQTEEADEEIPEDNYKALDGSALVLDPDDDGFAMHFPPVKTSSGSLSAAGFAGSANGRGASWTNRTIVEAERLEQDADEADASSVLRYLDAEQRTAMLPGDDVEGDDDEAVGGAAEAGGSAAASKGKAAEASTKKAAIPGAAVPTPNAGDKKRRNKKGPKGEA